MAEEPQMLEQQFLLNHHNLTTQQDHDLWFKHSSLEKPTDGA